MNGMDPKLVILFSGLRKVIHQFLSKILLILMN